MNENKFVDTKLNDQFIIQADWLVHNQEKMKYGSGWYLSYNIKDYSL
jgi:hypothetical protein